MPRDGSDAQRINERKSLLTSLEQALRAVDELVPLDDERFLRTHQIFEASSDQRALIVDWLSRHIRASAMPPGAIKLLGIGCGDGAVDLPAARALLAKTGQLHFVAVDPNAAELAELERAFGKAAMQGVDIETHAVSFDAFETAERFDRIHCVHSFYYMPDPAAALQRALRLLADGGELIFFHAPCGELNSLSTLFYDKHYGRPTMFAHEFVTMLDDAGYRYRHERLDAGIDVTSMADSANQTSLALRDFIVQYNSNHLPPSVVRLVERYLRFITRARDGVATIAHPVDVFVIGQQHAAQEATS